MQHKIAAILPNNFYGFCSAAPDTVPERAPSLHPPQNRPRVGRVPQDCSKVRPVEGRSCSAALKSEDRRPKPERRPKSEFREWPKPTGCCSAGGAINSDLGLRVAFSLPWPVKSSCYFTGRSSGLGFGMARAGFRAALSSPSLRPLPKSTRPHPTQNCPLAGRVPPPSTLISSITSCPPHSPDYMPITSVVRP